MNEVTKFNFEITSLQSAMEYAKMIADSDLAPKDFKGKPGNVLIAIQMGHEVGLKPLQSIQNIAVINSRPCIWGDAMIGLVQNHPLCEYIYEEFKNDTAYCIVKRRGENDEHVAKFSRDDAKKAGLLGKPGVWQQYPERMMQMRARGFALRDKFADILKGIAMREEVEDYQVIDESPREQRINKATSNVRKLIEGKSKQLDAPTITVDEIKSKIDSATSLHELAGIAPLAQSLNENDKKEIRKYYGKASENIKNKENPINPEQSVDESTGEIINPEYEKIKKQLLNAKSRDTLDIAADLINTITPEELQVELSSIYAEQKVKFY